MSGRPYLKSARDVIAAFEAHDFIEATRGTDREKRLFLDGRIGAVGIDAVEYDMRSGSFAVRTTHGLKATDLDLLDDIPWFGELLKMTRVTRTAGRTLCFDGMGASPVGAMESCRIRATFTNDAGRRVFLECQGLKKVPGSPCFASAPFNPVGLVDRAHLVTGAEDDERIRKLPQERSADHLFPFTHAGLIKFVNDEFDCLFGSVRIVRREDTYRTCPGPIVRELSRRRSPECGRLSR